jgi:arylsulfatase A-like enzyme
LAVDELVASLIEVLRTSGVLDDTYVLFTSDHGLHRGEHRLLAGKTSAYGASARVPLLVRGPRVDAGRVVDALALNTDLAPTVAALAGVDIPDFVDGRSLAPFLGREESPTWRHTVLLEHDETERRRLRRERSAPRNRVADPRKNKNVAVPSYRALRTPELLYIESATGERELYDLRADPDELLNTAETAASELLPRLSRRLADLAECAGGRCRTAEDAPLAGPQ